MHHRVKFLTSLKFHPFYLEIVTWRRELFYLLINQLFKPPVSRIQCLHNEIFSCNLEYKKRNWWWKYKLWRFCGPSKSFWYFRSPDIVGKMESLWHSWSLSNNWFKSYLSNCSQYVSINKHESELAATNTVSLKDLF